MERRWHPRTKADLPARIVVNGGVPVPCSIRDYSASGFFVATQATMARYQFVEVQLVMGNRSTQIIRGMVIHSKDGGAGIEAETRFWPRAIGLRDSTIST